MKAVVLSLDAELIWGFHDKDHLPTKRIESARDSWLNLLSLFDRYQIPATWAVVGHLFLDSCTGTHSDHAAGQDWFARDPGGEFTPGSNWFGRDLLDKIQDSDVTHEIGSHSFSHVEFGNTTKSIGESELQHCVDAATECGIDLDSFVFPRNKIGHRDLLAEYGFSCYRGRSPNRWYEETSFRQLGKLATFTLGSSGPPLVEPSVDEYGLVNVPASMYLFTFEGPPRRIVETLSNDPVIRQVKIGLEQLKDEQQGILHLWLHPNNLTSERDWSRLNRIISMIAQYRDQQDIEVRTMSQVAKKTI